MGRARGASIAVTATAGFSVFGTRRGSPQMQAERDAAEFAGDIIAQLKAVLAGPVDSCFAEASRFVRQFPQRLTSEAYGEIIGLLRDELVFSPGGLRVGLAQIEGMLRDGTMRDGDGELLVAAYDKLLLETPLTDSDEQQLLRTIRGPLPGHPDFAATDEDRPELARLRSNYERRIRADLLLLATPSPGRQPWFYKTKAGRIDLFKRILSAGAGIPPEGERNMARLGPLFDTIADCINRRELSKEDLMTLHGGLGKFKHSDSAELAKLQTALNWELAR